MPYNPSKCDQSDPSLPGMALDDWLYFEDLSYSKFAAMVPCSKPYPRLIAKGIQQPSYKMACRIEELTAGKVPRTRWYPAPADPKAGQNPLEEIFDDD